MFKKLISIVCAVCLVCTGASVFTVSAAGGAGVTTVAGDYFKANTVATDIQKDIGGVSGCAVTTNSDDSITFKITPEVSSENKVFQNRSTNYFDDFIGTGLIQVTYDYQVVGTIPAGATFTPVINICFDKNWDYNFKYTLKTDGVKHSLKGILDTTAVDSDGKVTIKWYEKDANNSSSEYEYVGSDTKKKYETLHVQPHYRFDYKNWSNTTPVDMITLDNFTVTELPVANIRSLSGVYADTDNVLAEFYLPEGYTSASLKLDGTTVSNYALADYPAGNWKASLPLAGISGKKVPVSLTYTDAAGTKTVSTSIGEVMKTGGNAVLYTENFDKVEFSGDATSVTDIATYRKNGSLSAIQLGTAVESEKTVRNASIEKAVAGISETPVYKVETFEGMSQVNTIYNTSLAAGYSNEVEFDVYTTGTGKTRLVGFMKGLESWPTGGGWFYRDLEVTPNKWHNVKFRIDATNSVMYTYVDGVYHSAFTERSGIVGASQLGFGISKRNTGDGDCTYYFDNIKFKSWAHSVQDFAATKDDNSVTVTFTGAADEANEEFGTVVIAAYDDSGLVDVKTVPSVSEKAGLQTYEAKFENVGSFTTAKAMLWNSVSGLKPILGAVDAVATSAE